MKACVYSWWIHLEIIMGDNFRENFLKRWMIYDYLRRLIALIIFWNVWHLCCPMINLPLHLHTEIPAINCFEKKKRKYNRPTQWAKWQVPSANPVQTTVSIQCNCLVTHKENQKNILLKPCISQMARICFSASLVCTKRRMSSVLLRNSRRRRHWQQLVENCLLHALSLSL